MHSTGNTPFQVNIYHSLSCVHVLSCEFNITDRDIDVTDVAIIIYMLAYVCFK